MHNIEQAPRPTSASYRERLSPSLWVLLSAAVCAPMASIVFVPLDGTIALIIGVAVGIAIIASLILTSPVLTLHDGVLRVGRARIAVSDLGTASAYTGDEARQARGAGLGRADWHLLRGGIEGVVRVEVIDPDDPTSAWVFSSRTPDRVAAMITRAQRER